MGAGLEDIYGPKTFYFDPGSTKDGNAAEDSRLQTTAAFPSTFPRKLIPAIDFVDQFVQGIHSKQVFVDILWLGRLRSTKHPSPNVRSRFNVFGCLFAYGTGHPFQHWRVSG